MYNVDESNEDVTYFAYPVVGYPKGVDVQVDDTGFVNLVQESRSDFDDAPEEVTISVNVAYAIINAYEKLVAKRA